MPELNLDAARKARQEARGPQDPKVLIFGERQFPLPDELPYEVGELWTEQRVTQGLRVLLDGQYDAFSDLHPSVDDVKALVENLAEMYGFGSPGESPAS
jgi:hypothetical protein